MKICFLTDSIFSFGGIQRVLAVITEALSEYHDITILIINNSEPEDLSMYGLQNSNIKFLFLKYPSIPFYQYFPNKLYSLLYKTILPHNRFTSCLYGLSSFPRIYRKMFIHYINIFHFDIVVGVQAFLALKLATINEHFQAKAIGWMHNSYEAFFTNNSAYLKGLDSYFSYQMARLNAVIVLTDNDKEKYQKYLNLNPIRIYNPLTLKPGELANKNNKRFLAIGRFTYLHKGFDILIKAFYIFTKYDKEWILDIVGEGPEKELYQSLIIQYHLENRVYLHPFTQNIQQYYSKAGIYVLSSRWEGFGLVIIEAMAHGLPVISSDINSSKEIMGNHAFYFKNGDIIDLSGTMLRAIKTPWDKLSKTSVQIASRFDINEIIAQWNYLFNRII